MKLRNILKAVLAVLACLGAVMPPADLLAAQTARKTQPKIAKLSDVALDARGVFNGTIVNANGVRMANSEVTILQGKKTIDRVRTDAKGRFKVYKLRGGVYQIKAGKNVAAVRVWSHRTAPPKALPQALLVTGIRTARGQGNIPLVEVENALLLAFGVTTVALSAINMHEIDDLQDEVNSLEVKIDQISASVNGG